MHTCLKKVYKQQEDVTALDNVRFFGHDEQDAEQTLSELLEEAL